MTALIEWLERRSLDPELADRMGWGFTQHPTLGPALKIPYIRDGRVVNVQYRALGKKEFRFTEGSEIELWNVDVLKNQTLAKHPLVMAEGACDGLALVQCGFPRTVAVPGWSAKNFEPDNYAPFTRNEQALAAAKRIVVAQDADDTGATMLRAVANFLDECEVYYVTWPEDCKDANDTLHKHGPDAVVRAISSARAVDPAGGLITGFSDLPPRQERRVWRLDFPELDKVMAFRSRAISTLTGTPGAGKTTFMVWVANHLVRANGMRVGLALFETEAQEVLLQLARLKGKQTEYMTEPEWDEFKAELDRHYRIAHRVDDNETLHGMAWLKGMIHKLAARDHCSVIIVDPWNELEHMLERGESLTAYTNLALKRLRQWAEKYSIHICIVAHPRKLQVGERANGYHISDSAAWFNKVDMGWTVNIEEGTDEEAEHVSLTCWKVRSRQGTGCRPGRIKLSFDEHSMVYRPLSRRSVASAYNHSTGEN